MASIALRMSVLPREAQQEHRNLLASSHGQGRLRNRIHWELLVTMFSSSPVIPAWAHLKPFDLSGKSKNNSD